MSLKVCRQVRNVGAGRLKNKPPRRSKRLAKILYRPRFSRRRQVRNCVSADYQIKQAHEEFRIPKVPLEKRCFGMLPPPLGESSRRDIDSYVPVSWEQSGELSSSAGYVKYVTR